MLYSVLVNNEVFITLYLAMGSSTQCCTYLLAVLEQSHTTIDSIELGIPSALPYITLWFSGLILWVRGGVLRETNPPITSGRDYGREIG